jgi:hypothetical protein
MGFWLLRLLMQSLDSVVTVTTPFTMPGGFKALVPQAAFPSLVGSGFLTLELNQALVGNLSVRKATLYISNSCACDGSFC